MDIAASRIWAGALFEAATARGEQVRVQEELDGAARLVSELPLLHKALESPLLTRGQKAEVVETAFGDGLSPLVCNLLALLGRRMKIRLLPSIERTYSHLVDECCGLVTAEVVTAVGIPERLLDPLREALERRLVKSVRIQAKVDPSIVGGILVTAGGWRLDGTIRGELEGIREALLGDDPWREAARVQA
jgi:F-type H+-transporting ATPase subunit delta